MMVSASDDAVLVSRALQGDQHAARLIWDRNAKMVRGLVVRLLGPRPEVDDVVQDVFTALFRRLRSLHHTDALQRFLVGIAIREVRSELRRRRARSWLHLTDSGDPPDILFDIRNPQHEGFSRLNGILDQLDPHDRMAFVLRHIEGLELTEVAEALDWSLATVKRRLHTVHERVNRHVSRDSVLSAYAEPRTWKQSSEDLPPRKR